MACHAVLDLPQLLGMILALVPTRGLLVNGPLVNKRWRAHTKGVILQKKLFLIAGKQSTGKKEGGGDHGRLKTATEIEGANGDSTADQASAIVNRPKRWAGVGFFGSTSPIYGPVCYRSSTEITPNPFFFFKEHAAEHLKVMTYEEFTTPALRVIHAPLSQPTYPGLQMLLVQPPHPRVEVTVIITHWVKEGNNIREGQSDTNFSMREVRIGGFLHALKLAVQAVEQDAADFAQHRQPPISVRTLHRAVNVEDVEMDVNDIKDQEVLA